MIKKVIVDIFFKQEKAKTITAMKDSLEQL